MTFLVGEESSSLKSCVKVCFKRLVFSRVLGAVRNYGTIRLYFEEKCGTKLRKLFSGIVRYSIEIRCYFFCTALYSFRKPNLRSPKGLLW